MNGTNSDEIADFANLAINNPYQVRFIEYMPFTLERKYLFAADKMKQQLLKAGFGKLIPEMSNHSPAQIYRFPQAQGSIGFITPISQHFCSSCNRIRLTPDGNLKPCLLSNQEYSLRERLRAGISDQKLLDTIKQVIWNKPKECDLRNGEKSKRGMHRIGG
jgi:cyclic pyranopterin phosphate synthase